MKRQPEVYELIKALEYFYQIAVNISANLEKMTDKENHNPTESSIRRFSALKEQIDQHIAEIIDELHNAKNGALQ